MFIASKVMLKILQARLQEYVNWRLPDVQIGFRKGRGTRDQIVNIRCVCGLSCSVVSDSCNPIDCSPPGSSVHGILQARILEWQWWKIESISPEIRNKTRVPTFTTTIQHSFGSVGPSNQGRKRSKRNPDRRRRSETLAVRRWHDALRRKP